MKQRYSLSFNNLSVGIWVRCTYFLLYVYLWRASPSKHLSLRTAFWFKLDCQVIGMCKCCVVTMSGWILTNEEGTRDIGLYRESLTHMSSPAPLGLLLDKRVARIAVPTNFVVWTQLCHQKVSTTSTPWRCATMAMVAATLGYKPEV